MRVYLSYPMTRALPEDLPLIEDARRALRRARIPFYDPANMEPKGWTINALQDWDLDQMDSCTHQLVVWTPRTEDSRGVNAEMEWAARIFGIPIYAWHTGGFSGPEPWPAATIRKSGGFCICDLASIIETIKDGALNQGRILKEIKHGYDDQRASHSAAGQAGRRRRTQGRHRKAIARASTVGGSARRRARA